MLRLCDVSSMTLHFLCCRMNVSVCNISVLHIEWFDCIQKDHLWTWVNSLRWLVCTEHVRLVAHGFSVICSIPATSSSHWPTISFILSIHKSYCMSVRSLSTNYTCSCSDEEGKDRKYVVGWRWGCFCDKLSSCIWFQVLWECLLLQVCFVRRFLEQSSVVSKLRQKSAVKKSIVSFIQRIVAVVALWSSVINDLPTASVFVCQAVPRGSWKCWTLYFSAGQNWSPLH